jgi:hypothetical protein
MKKALPSRDGLARGHFDHGNGIVALCLAMIILGSATTPLGPDSGGRGAGSADIDRLAKSMAGLPPEFAAPPGWGAEGPDMATLEAYATLRENPGAVLASMALLPRGREKIALARAILGDGPLGESASIAKAMEPFLDAKTMTVFKGRLARAGLGLEEALARGEVALRKDAVLHIMGGAAIALLAAAIAFEFLPAWSPLERALLLAAIGIGAATFFGALKEAMDAFGPGALELRDFLNSIAGGAMAGLAIAAFASLLAATGISIVAGIVIFAVGSLVLGLPVGKVFIESSLGGLRAPRVAT